MEWVAVAIAFLAATAAVWQAWEARRANRDASAHEQGAWDAQRRVADALERQTQLAEEAARPPVPWVFEALSPADMDQRWRAVNRTGFDAADVHLLTPDGAGEQWIVPDIGAAVDVPAGEAVGFTFIRRLSSPSTRTVTVHWTEAGEQRRYTHPVR
ncbi:hypothetical protein EDM22_12345 [Agromyces tardus]|uniref:Uncharacterized protein n=1 Tax=Agromyces tardus TaxID=2583849 RepID=A0A3M8A8G5_9MICO|nr:hypothetical protein [Agromyces tardus]RNB47414.1 hypothetical protein EDM22_12345 [Agromyces tardus]